MNEELQSDADAIQDQIRALDGVIARSQETPSSNDTPMEDEVGRITADQLDNAVSNYAQNLVHEIHSDYYAEANRLGIQFNNQGYVRVGAQDVPLQAAGPGILSQMSSSSITYTTTSAATNAGTFRVNFPDNWNDVNTDNILNNWENISFKTINRELANPGLNFLKNLTIQQPDGK